MKRILFFLSALLFSLLLNGQAYSQGQGVAVNADGSLPDANAMLDVKATNKGILIPRIDYNNRPTSGVTTGMLIFVTANGPAGNNAFYYYDGTTWQQVRNYTQTQNLSLGHDTLFLSQGNYIPLGSVFTSQGYIKCGSNYTNPATDNTNCGACGVVCPAGEICSGGSCVVSCGSGLTNCGGTCTNTITDNNNCGACGTVCPTGYICSGGTCNIACGSGLTNCGGTCANTTSDPNNCGACGNVCPAGLVCQFGACTLVCAGGTTKCGSLCVNTMIDPANCGACGTVCPTGYICSGGTCNIACGSGLTNCGGTCANTTSDPNNCGACGTACPAGQVCQSGACTIVCAGGSTKCGSLCVDLSTDNANCGACVHPCPAGKICSGSTCVATCASPLVACSGTCVDTRYDPANCGGCGVVCNLANAVAGCGSGACLIVSCNAGFGNCDGLTSNGCEVNLNTNVNNCGGCGSVCSLPNATAGCSSGACSIASCNAGYANCDGLTSNGCETNTSSSVANCGACGFVCSTPANAVAGCSGGACGIASCNAGYANCDGLVSNGCETNTSTSVANCGACGFVCSLANATPACSSGACSIASCNAGYANCDGVASNGCEVNLNTDVNNCGGCGHVCPGGDICSSGVCMP